ncbi:MAG: hypothetical protein SFW09_20705 [Hyphomicrobiaceae bacterium]|nr:hypothetical protein [Hyphomicrobiaceae bacterium]
MGRDEPIAERKDVSLEAFARETVLDEEPGVLREGLEGLLGSPLDFQIVCQIVDRPYRRPTKTFRDGRNQFVERKHGTLLRRHDAKTT